MDQMHENFGVEIADYTEWKERNKTNNFFEIAYVLEGKGLHSANYVKQEYHKNCIFLLPAASCHAYEIEESTRFMFVRFTGSYFRASENQAVDYSNWFSRLNFIIGNHNYLSGELVEDPDDKIQLKRLMDAILYEYEKKDSYAALIIQNTLVSMLTIICRNIEANNLTGPNHYDDKFAGILNFIHYNILDQSKLSVKYLADHFNISENYFSEYFKRNAAERFQDFVLKSKLRIAESRAKYTDAPFREIAYELGFTDSSHLNRMMRKFAGKGMSQLRKEML